MQAFYPRECPSLALNGSMPNNCHAGAGIMALPRAFATLGLALGGVLLILVFGLSLFSLSALVKAARSAGCWTYAELAHVGFGIAGSSALQGAIVVNNSGSMIIYLIIIADILCGVAPDYNGLITNIIGIHDPSVVYVSRPFVVSYSSDLHGI